MVWLFAFLCLGLLGVSGYYSGPIRSGFSLLGLFFGAILAHPLSPLTRHLLPLVGLEHPIWQLFIPQALACIVVLIVFIIAGSVVHRQVTLHFKYKVDEKKLIAWERMFSRLGFCIGVANGAVAFCLLMLPIYLAGYFTAEAATESNNPAGAKFLTHMRAELHADHLDKMLEAYDPIPDQVYQASDILDLVMHNPLLKSRIAHYPPLLTLGQRPEFEALANDVTLLEMMDRQASIREILEYPPIQAIVTNAALTGQIYNILDNDLSDLQNYLMTGKSKFDEQIILGVWVIDPRATLAQERKRHPGMTSSEIKLLRQQMRPVILDLSLLATTDHQMILKKLPNNSSKPTVVSVGSWKKDGDDYVVTLPGSKPETTEIGMPDSQTLLLPKDGYVMVFDKEM